jgi:heat shock protein HslJ
MQQAEDFLIALSNASALRRDARQLVLLDANGKAVAILAAQRRELSGTSWLVTGYNNGKQAVVNVLAGSALTVDFGAAGSVIGSAGCNNYTAIYAASGKRHQDRRQRPQKMCVPGGCDGAGRPVPEGAANGHRPGASKGTAWSPHRRGALAVTLSTAKGFHGRP